MHTRFRRIAADGTTTAHDRAIAGEHPVAIEINGLGYAVMMATPVDLKDFATGFALAERIITAAHELRDLDLIAVEGGTVARLTVSADRAATIAVARARVTDSACGLCGIDNIDRVHRPLPRVPATNTKPQAIFRALTAIRDHQPLNAATGAAHAAMACASDGSIRLSREDVGRHNAFDKLVGAMARQGMAWDGGFALLTSRCSYELVEKAALAACPMLVTVSAATDLALARAAQAGLTLVSLARDDAVLFSDPNVEDVDGTAT